MERKEKVDRPLEGAPKRESPERGGVFGRSVKRVARTAFLFGAAVGLLNGAIITFFLLLASGVVAFGSVQRCDLLAFGPVPPDVPSSAPKVCWTQVDIPDVNGSPPVVFVCPSKYSIQLKLVAGELNGDVVREVYDNCRRVQEYLSLHTLQLPEGEEVNG